MEGIFVREGNTNYLKISESEKEETATPPYLIKMLSNNEIEGILKVNIQYVDNKIMYCYDVKTYRPLSMLYQSRDMKIEEAAGILKNLDAAVKRLSEFFLDRDGILLNPQYIMLDDFDKRARFVYLPCNGVGFNEQLRRLLEFIMEHMEHKDREKTIRFYEAYQEVIRGDSDIYGIIRRLEGEDAVKSPQINEYIIPAVMDEPVDEEKETVSFNPGRASVIIKAVSAIAAIFIIMSQIFSDVLPLNISLGTAAVLLAASAAAHIAGGWLGRQPASRFARLERSESRMPYSFHTQSVMERVNDDDSIRSRPDEPVNGQAAAMSGTSDISDVSDISHTSEKNDDAQTNPTQLLSGAIRKNYIIKLAAVDSHTNDILIDTVPCVIGSLSSSADVVAEEPFVSRMHARITGNPEAGYYIQDLFSTNGTFINDERLMPQEKHELRDNDTVTLAASKYTVSMRIL